MEIVLGKTAGFCFGVQNAVESTINEVKSNNSKIYCLGELAHNKQVIDKIEKMGVEFINDYNQVKDTNSKVIIRAHGIPNYIYHKLEKRGIKIKDYTCPKVIRVHKIAWKYAKNDFFIFLCGKSSHPEIIGTRSYCGNNYCIIEEEKDLEEAIKHYEKSKLKKALIIAQTTFSVKKFTDIQNKIKERLGKDKIIVKNTICRATELRQKETDEISKKVDCMIIIGGKNSSNTNKLFEISKKNCNIAYHIETPEELNYEEIEKYNKIGIMAGASTPKESIEQLVRTIERKEGMKI